MTFAYLDLLAGKADDSLDEEYLGIGRSLSYSHSRRVEHNQVAARRWREHVAETVSNNLVCRPM